MRYPVIYTDNMAAWKGGYAAGPLIVLRPKYRNDEGIYQHELTHVKQGVALLFIGHALLYLFYKPYRLWAEVQAYKKQTQYGMSIETGAWRLYGAGHDTYNFGITLDEARELLT